MVALVLVFAYLCWIGWILCRVWWPCREWYQRVQRYRPWGVSYGRRR